MVLICGACGAQREPDQRASSGEGADLRGRVRCPVCGLWAARVVPSVPPRAEGSMPSMPPLQDLGAHATDPWAGRPLRLRRGSREFRVRDLDRLRRLVVERKAAGSDLVSADGVRWVPLSSIPALEPFLAVVRLLDSGGFTAGGGTLVDATAAELGWGADRGSTADGPDPAEPDEDIEEISEPTDT